MNDIGKRESKAIRSKDNNLIFFLFFLFSSFFFPFRQSTRSFSLMRASDSLIVFLEAETSDYLPATLE